MLLFNNAYPNLFTGHAQFSIPIWTPQGRHGMAPSLSLSYSSGTTDGILGDVQAPWVGEGWNIDSVEIARQITNGVCAPCGGNSYGYVNSYLLLFNGTGYPLIPDGTTAGRYHTQSESFLYIQLHNNNLNQTTGKFTGQNFFSILYQHITNPQAETGSWVKPDTLLGYVNNNQQHIHLEISQSNSPASNDNLDPQKDTFYNPLLFMTASQRSFLESVRENQILNSPEVNEGTFIPGYDWWTINTISRGPGDIP